MIGYIKKFVFIVCIYLLFSYSDIVIASEINQESMTGELPSDDNREISSTELTEPEQPTLPEVDSMPIQVEPQESQRNTETKIEGFELLDTIMIANNEANVRSGPDTRYKSLGRLKIGQQVYVLGRVPGDWYQIAFEDGSAFVFGDYLTQQESNGTEANTEEETEEVRKIEEAENKIKQLQKELSEAKKKVSEVQKNVIEITHKSDLEEEEPETKKSEFFAVVIAILLAVIFIVKVILVLNPYQK